MSRYTFTFKKDDVFVEFTTEDRDVVEKQFQIWVADADEYARNGKVKYQKKTSTSNIETQKAVSEPVIIENKPKEKEQESSYDKESAHIKTINSIQSEQLTVEPKEEKEEIKEEVKEEQPQEIKIPVSNDFEAVLGKTMENPAFEPDKIKDQIFLNLVKSKNTNDKFHYLIITAYYLSEFEKLERFSLKQINSKIMQNLSEVIDHTTLQEALSQNFLELVPDLTGTSEVAEYKLTSLGEDFFANKI